MGLLLLASVACSRLSEKDHVSPGTKHFLVFGSGTRSFEVEVDLAQAPPSTEPIDVLLLFDMTMSMENVAREAREGAVEIVDAVRRISENAAFAVASFADYPLYDSNARTPWELYLDLATDSSAVHAALQQVRVIGSGGDAPEAYSRALYESQFLKWRPGSRRFIILFGDSVAHDTGFYGSDLGADPGRDGRVGTADDLSLRNVVETLASMQISVSPVYDPSGASEGKPLQEEAQRGFQFMAAMTGGVARTLSSAGDLPAMVESGVREGFSPEPRLAPGERREAWVSIGEPRRSDDSRTRFRFPVEVRVPTEANGVHRIPLYAVIGEASDPREIGRSDVIIRIGLLGLPWYWLGGVLWVLLVLAWMLARARERTALDYRLLYGRAWLPAPVLALLVVVSVAIVPVAVWHWGPGRVPALAAPLAR
jgi:hypothetical protein